MALRRAGQSLGRRCLQSGGLKTMQKAITLIVFVIFSALYLSEPLRWSTALGFLLIFADAGLIFLTS